MIDSEKLNYILKNVTRPARYTGGEIGCSGKQFKESTVNILLSFPDLYEIGISNFGLKILYNLINREEDFFADRMYAPDKDFKQELLNHGIPLYGLESRVSAISFDIVAFSLQYELNYTTMIGMLELSGIPMYSSERDDSFPLVIAGGPSCYDSEPFADFVDAILVGDGEELIIELLRTYKKLKYDSNLTKKEILKQLAQIDGVYVPSLYAFEEDGSFRPLDETIPKRVKRRISSVNYEDHPVESPIPNIAAVHDRTVIEIRRGCARMCRFCQSCFVTLPVRERPAEDIASLCKKSIAASGFDEYSLLSLSSSDYKDIEVLAVQLNNEFAPQKVSISLPSQRADSFNIDLAQEIQAVRKSTLTFAPEAGSDRLRRVINKNLSQDQILNAALSAYQAGWNKIKFYFIIGLPTETYEDLDAICELIGLIKGRARLVKKENNIQKPLEITCTLSNFVPKPFTPLQWSEQLSELELKNRKYYLLDKIKSVKGVNFKFHDVFTSKLECLLSRGDRSLSKLLVNAYKEGSYLDSWRENFSKKLWESALQKSEIDIEKLTNQRLEIDKPVPWEIIDVGLNKAWLAQEWDNAIKEKNTIPCQDHCVNCGICVNFKVSPSYESSKENLKITEKFQNDQRSCEKFKYRFKITKERDLRYISHLDWFRMIYRAAKRANLPLIYSQGFNPAPKLTITFPLGLFIESIYEYMEMELSENLLQTDVMESLNRNLPMSSQIFSAEKIINKEDCLAKKICWASYVAYEENPSFSNLNFDLLENNLTNLLDQKSIMLNKKTKSKLEKIDVKQYINFVSLERDNVPRLKFDLKATPEITIKPTEFLNLFANNHQWKIVRVGFKNENLESF